jgi:hypothetical protein
MKAKVSKLPGEDLDCLARCADIAEQAGVELIVEPVNRYEVNFINNCTGGLKSCGKAVADASS